MKTKYFSLVLTLMLPLAACTTDASDDSEIWQEPVASKDANRPSVQPDAEPQETPAEVMEAEAAARPWEPDTSMGAEVSEGGLTFEGESIKKGPDEGEDKISDAFNPNAGYENDDALTGRRIAPEPGNTGVKRTLQTLWVASKSVKIRTAPSPESPVAGTLRQGTKVKVISQTANWSKIGPDRYVETKDLTSRKR
jgi:uncharacterized protein YgiM (DUF1202 family)